MSGIRGSATQTPPSQPGDRCDALPSLTGDMAGLPARAGRIGDGSEPVAQPPLGDAAGAADELCRLFDSLIEACRHADADGDPDTITLIERAIVHVGDRIDRRLAALERAAPTQ